MQKNIISNITTTLKEAREQYSKEILKAIDTNSTDDILEISNNVQNINMALSIFEKSINKNVSNSNGGAKRGRKPKNIETMENKEKSVSKNIMTLDDNLVGKRPIGVTIERHKFEVSSFRDVVRVVCNYFFNKDIDMFKSLVNNPSVNGDEHQYFSIEMMEGKNLDELVNDNGETMYVDTAKLAVNNMFFLKRMLAALNFDIKKIKLTIDENYTRKERTKKAVVNQ